MAHHLEHLIFRFVEDWLAKEQLEVVLQRQVDHHRDRIVAALAGDLGDGAVRTEHGVHDVEPIPFRWPS